jgi:hypothetical protein
LPDSQPDFLPLAVKTAICHTVTYALTGVLALNALHYGDFVNRLESGMRSSTSVWVLLGPVFQPLRGVLFATVFYPLRSVLFGRRSGWLIMSWMLIAFGILGTLVTASGSLQGVFFSSGSPLLHLRGWLEIVPQAVLLSVLLCVWVDHPKVQGLNWLLGGLFAVCLALPALSALRHHWR